MSNVIIFHFSIIYLKFYKNKNEEMYLHPSTIDINYKYIRILRYIKSVKIFTK